MSDERVAAIGPPSRTALGAMLDAIDSAASSSHHDVSTDEAPDVPVVDPSEGNSMPTNKIVAARPRPATRLVVLPSASRELTSPVAALWLAIP
jgi:hypothetical protein